MMRAPAAFLIPPMLAMSFAFILMTQASAQGQRPGPPAQGESQAPAPPSNGEPLSKKLEKNDGVLVPPSGVDPKIHKEPPANTGDRMPVIIPPGEPGGDQSIQPK